MAHKMQTLLKHTQEQTQLEEVINAISHGVGLILAIAGLVLMIVVSSIYDGVLQIVTCTIYGSSLVIMFVSSVLYHSTRNLRRKRILQIVDHSSVYILIAGTYTPFMLVVLGGTWGWALLSVVWVLAFVGVIFKIFFTGKYEWFALSLYVGMGWIVLLVIKPIAHLLPHAALIWLFAGGISYTTGIIFYIYDTKYHFSHFIWHLFVLMGTICHFIAVLFYVI